MQTQLELAAPPYGCAALGKLRAVLMHRPGPELDLVDAANAGDWLFNAAPDRDGMAAEHELFREMLKRNGVEVYELSHYVHHGRLLLPRLPNLMYLNDTAVITNRGSILSAMGDPGRKHESLIVKEALNNLGVPPLIELNGPDDAMEGAVILSNASLLVFNTERCKYTSVHRFIHLALQVFDEVVYVDLPKNLRFAHANRVFNRIRTDLALAYLPVLQDCFLFRKGYVRKLNFRDYLGRRGTEVVGVSDDEQMRLACAFVLLDSGKIIQFEGAFEGSTLEHLERRGIEVLSLQSQALRAGSGGPQCLTLDILRTSG